jgi:hypothetical protein
MHIRFYNNIQCLGICYPAEFVDRIRDHTVTHTLFPKFMNITIHMLTWIGLIVSSLSLVFLNLDKLFYFRFPLRYVILT